MSKAVREAKINSTWASPNLQYEESVTSFVTELLELNQKNAFLQDFIPFQKKIAFYGFLNTLSQSKRGALKKKRQNSDNTIKIAGAISKR